MARLEVYHALLLKWQKAINLVSPATLDQAWERHFADSAQLTEWIGFDAQIADLGSGAGFPGMVLAMLRPDLDMHLIESDERKAQFLKTVSRETSIPVTIHNARIEKTLPALAPDIITARAFAPLNDILEICRPALAVNPALQVVLLKGKKAVEEIAAAQKSFAFDVKDHPSETDPGGRILIIKGIKLLSR